MALLLNTGGHVCPEEPNPAYAHGGSSYSRSGYPAYIKRVARGFAFRILGIHPR